MSNTKSYYFEEVFGFREKTSSSRFVDPKQVRSQIKFDAKTGSLTGPNGVSYGVGEFSTPTLASLRSWYGENKSKLKPGKLMFTTHAAPVQVLHGLPEYKDAIFLAASQFNCLEFPAPDTLPEQGIAVYQDDRTQGPSCAMMAAPATFYRNYLHIVNEGELGQTKTRQVSNLRDVVESVIGADRPTDVDCVLRNGYTRDQGSDNTEYSSPVIKNITDRFDVIDSKQREEALSKLRIGVHANVQVTLPSGCHMAWGGSKEELSKAVDYVGKKPRVTQIYAAAMSLGLYEPRWVSSYEAAKRAQAPFYKEVLDRTYEAVFLYALKEGKTLILTRLGGGVFANWDGAYGEPWAVGIIAKYLTKFKDHGLNVVMNDFEAHPSRWKKTGPKEWSGGNNE